jgi:hypothetical protein
VIAPSLVRILHSIYICNFSSGSTEDWPFLNFPLPAPPALRCDLHLQLVVASRESLG